MAEPDPASDRIAFLRGLRSVRQFRPGSLPQQVVDDLLEVARWTGSAKNRQPWEFVVVRDPTRLRALAHAEGYARHLEGASLGIVLVMAGNPEQVAQETYDEGRLSERIMLAALAHGVGSCIGWFAGGGMAQAKQILSIPPERLVRTALSLGYLDEQAHRGRRRPAEARKPLAKLVHEERYG